MYHGFKKQSGLNALFKNPHWLKFMCRTLVLVLYSKIYFKQMTCPLTILISVINIFTL